MEVQPATNMITAYMAQIKATTVAKPSKSSASYMQPEVRISGEKANMQASMTSYHRAKGPTDTVGCIPEALHINDSEGQEDRQRSTRSGQGTEIVATLISSSWHKPCIKITSRG